MSVKKHTQYIPILLSILLTVPLMGTEFFHTDSGYHDYAIDDSDRIIAVVNDRIILKSDVDLEISDYLRQMRMNNQQVQFNESLWYGVLESMIDNFVLLEKAQMDSVEVSDDLVERQMNRRIDQMIRQAGSEQALERAFDQSIVELRAEHRETFREQLIVQQVREQKIQEVKITRPEVREFFESIPGDSVPVIPEQVALSQIVTIPPPLEDAERAAREKAAQIRDSIVVHGESFEEMARKHSTGPSARNGGLLPMMPMSDLVSEYAAAAAALEPGEVSSVVRSSFGYHVIRLNERAGENIETNNILITVDEQGIDEDAAIQKLEAVRDSILTEDISFSGMARKHSDDELSRNFGGRITNQETGERMLVLSNLDPSLYRIALLLNEEGTISEPRSYTTENGRQAYRIIRLDQHVPEHRANLEQDYDRIRDFALQQKQMRILTEWLAELRNDIYIEYKIDVPEQYREPQPDLHDIEIPPETQPGPSSGTQ
ncbi:MAG: peptidylprolyl isomerase [Balneolaceae bacterium]